MKKILILLILLSTSAFAQQGAKRIRADSLVSFTPSSFVFINDSLRLAQFIQADSTGFPIAPSFGSSRLVFRGDSGVYIWDGNSRWRLDTNYTGTFALKTYVDSIANLKVDTIYRTSGKDSIQFTLGGRYHAIRDSLGAFPAGSGSEIQYRLTANTFGAISGSSVSGTTATIGKLSIDTLGVKSKAYILDTSAVWIKRRTMSGDPYPLVVGDSIFNTTGVDTGTGNAIIVGDTAHNKVAAVIVGSSYTNFGFFSWVPVNFFSPGNPPVPFLDIETQNNVGYTCIAPGGGRVGIGTNHPAANLDVLTQSTYASPPTTEYINFKSGSTSGIFTFEDASTPSLQRTNYFDTVQYGGIDVIIDTAVTVEIEGAPRGGSGGSINNAYALRVKNGATRLGGNLSIAGTASLDGLTLGSVPFIGTGGAFRQNNAKFFWDSTNARLGVGTTTPSVSIEVVKDSGDGQADIHTTTYSTNGGGIFHGRFARGTKASPRAVAGGDIIAGIGGRAYDGTTFPNSSTASQHWVADDSQTVSNHAQHINWLTTPIGSTTRTGRMRLDESGYLNLGDTTKPYDFLSLYNTSVKNVFNMTATDKNTNKTTAASAKDTSSIAFSFSANTGKPITSMIDGSGRSIFRIDTNGGIWSQSYPTDANALAITSRGFFTFRDANSPVTTSAEMGAFSYNAGGGGGLNAGFRLYTSGGSVSSPTATLSGHGGYISFIGHDGTNYVTGSKAIVTLEATGNWSTTSTPTKITFGTTPTGSTTRATRMVIDTLGALVLNSVVRGSDAFTTTATEDTVAIAGAGTGDFYWIQITGTAAPSANDLCRVEATATGFIVHRAASGTSGLTYNWLRIK